MAQLSRFMDGPYYGSHDFAEFFTNFLSTGFFSGLEVEATNTMNVIVKPGSAFIEGYEYRNTEELTLTVPTAAPTTDRIDRIVVRLDRTPDASEHMTAMVRSGAAQPPNLIRNESIHEISLAQIRVEAGKSYIEQYQVTDERGDKDLCGRVTQPSRLTEQIDDVDVKHPDTRSSQYSEGSSSFYIHGTDNADLLQAWLDSVGVSPSTYGRPLSSLRMYVETIGSRTDTGKQRVTIFDWARGWNYQTYQIFERTSNADFTGVEPWGRWQEHVFVFERGQTANGRYVRYSDGWQKCYSPFFQTTVENSTGSVYNSDAITWEYPASFITSGNFPIFTSVSSAINSRWGDMSGTPESDVLLFRVFSSVQSSTLGNAWVMAEGRWR